LAHVFQYIHIYSIVVYIYFRNTL